MKYFKYFLPFFFIITICSGQAIQWQSMNGFTGLISLSEGNDNTLYGSTGLYAYQSPDVGLSWTSMTIPYYGSITELVANRSVIVLNKYVRGYKDFTQVYMSSDGGTSWSLILSWPGDFSNFMISDQGSIYALNYIRSLGEEGTVLTLFNDTTWDTYGVRVPVDTMIIDHEENFIGQGTTGGVYISTNLGNSWNEYFHGRSCSSINVNLSNTIIIGINPSSSTNNDGGVFISTDHGSTWKLLGLSDRYIWKVVADDRGNYFALTPDGIYRYNESLDLWKNIAPISQRYSTLFTTTNGLLFSISSGSKVLYRSEDAGENWSPTALNEVKVFSLHATPTGSILAGTLGTGLFKVPSGKTNWYEVSSESFGDNVYAINQSDTTIFACTDEGLCISVDDGENWHNISKSHFGGSVYSVVVGNDGSYIAATNFGVYVSSDQGLHWSVSSLKDMKVFFLAKSPAGVIYAATENDGIFASSDNGFTWESRGAVRNDIEALAVNSNGDVYVGVYGGVLKSTNGGNSWVSSVFTNTYINAIEFNSNQDVIVGTYNGIYRSLNAGVSWATAGLAGANVFTLDFDNLHNLLAGVYGGGVYISKQPVTSVEPSLSGLPIGTELYQNYPNPFNPRTEIRFSMKQSAQVMLSIIDILGREVETLLNDRKPAGVSAVFWDATNYTSGIYFYRLNVDGKTQLTRKMILMK
jgi:photosystem II stability/assembly factor-like uncharacterized protein